jgi:hypothetical protein
MVPDVEGFPVYVQSIWVATWTGYQRTQTIQVVICWLPSI